MRFRRFNLFEGAVPEKENHFTLLFRNFLQFDSFRRTFLKLIKLDFELDGISIDDINTQISLKRFGQPDIIISNDEIEILFEVKVWGTGLTLKQPSKYIEYLAKKSKKKIKALVLLCPEDYPHKNTWDKRKNDFLNANTRFIGNDIHIQIIYWNEIIDLIRESNLDKLDPLLDEYFRFLQKWFHAVPIQFNQNNITTMFNKEFPESLKKIIMLIEGVSKKLHSRKLKPKKNTNTFLEQQDFAYGIYFDLPNGNTLWFGMWLYDWERTGNPLCLSIDVKTSAFKTLSNRFNKNCTSLKLPEGEIVLQDDEEFFVTYFKQDFLMNSICEDKIAEIIEFFYRDLKTALKTNK